VRIETRAARSEIRIAVESSGKKPVEMKLLGADGKLLASGKCLGKAPVALAWEPGGAASASLVVSTAEERTSVKVTVAWRCR
jgi:hypothetical protein